MSDPTMGPDADVVRIRRWLDERSRRAPLPDHELVRRRTLERLLDEPQARGRWPLRWWRSGPAESRSEAHVRWGTTTRRQQIPMAAGVLIALAVAAVSVLGVASMQAGPTLAPGATTETPGPEAAARVSGTLGWHSAETAGEVTFVDGGSVFDTLTIRRGQVQSGMTVRSDDPRFAGESTITFNDERYSGARVGTIWGTHRIEDAEGAWSGRLLGSGDPATLEAHALGRYEGEGANEGLVAIVFHDLRERTFEGVIVPEAFAPQFDAVMSDPG